MALLPKFPATPGDSVSHLGSPAGLMHSEDCEPASRKPGTSGPSPGFLRPFVGKEIQEYPHLADMYSHNYERKCPG